MKKLVMLFALISMVACKNKEVKPAEEIIETDAVETVAESTIDYESYGMQPDDAPKGLETGSKAPIIDLTIDGKKVALADLYKDQNVAIIFYRGFWCPHCSKHLTEFATRAKELEDKGVKLIAITPEGEEGLYLGFSHLHSFISSIVGFGLSGWLLSKYCPDPRLFIFLRLLNNRWIIADFSDGKYWGEMIMTYEITDKQELKFKLLDYLLYH